MLRKIVVHALWHIIGQGEYGPFNFCSEICRKKWIREMVLDKELNYRLGINNIEIGDQCDECCNRVYDTPM